MKFTKYLLLLFLLSCSDPNQQKETALDSSENSSNTEIQKKEKFNLKAEIDRYFENIEEKIWENEYGGGDCWNTYKEYITELNAYYAIRNNLDCGDYGFTNFRLIMSGDKEPQLLEKTSKEWRMADTIPYLIKEWIIDFTDTTKIYYRRYSTDKFELSMIPDSISFSLTEKKDLNLNQTLESIKSDRTAKNE